VGGFTGHEFREFHENEHSLAIAPKRT